MSKKNSSEPPVETGKAQAWLRVGRGGRVRLGSPTDPVRARATAQRVRGTRPLGSSDWVEVHEVRNR